MLKDFAFTVKGRPGVACARASSGQDLGDGVWPVLAALLPRTAEIEVFPLRVSAKPAKPSAPS